MHSDLLAILLYVHCIYICLTVYIHSLGFHSIRSPHWKWSGKGVYYLELHTHGQEITRTRSTMSVSSSQLCNCSRTHDHYSEPF